MGTCNFPQPKLKNIYSLGANYEYDEADLLEDDINFIIADILNKTDFEENEGYEGDKRIIGSLILEYYNRDNKEYDEVQINLVTINGYYSGVMFDVDFSELEGIELTKTKQLEFDRKINKLEKVLKENTTAIKRVAQFSNGEAIYEKV